jgi:long-chain acyl-CoA synthetase
MFLSNSIRRAALINPQGVATVCRGRTQTWAEMAARVARLSGVFRARGLSPGDRIAVLASNSDRYLEITYAAFWSGVIIVPINTRLSFDGVKTIVKDCEPRMLFLDDLWLDRAFFLAPHGTEVIEIARGADYESWIAEAYPAPDINAPDNTPAAIFYTGGTTGDPKGAVLTHGNLVSNTMNCTYEMGFQRDSRFLHAPPLFHVGANSAACALTMHGGTHVFLDGFDPVQYAQTIESQHITDVFLVPTMLAMLVDSAIENRRAFACVRSVMYGGSPISPRLLKNAREVFRNAKFRQFYGMTEITASGTVLRPEHHEDPSKLSSAGQPMFSVELKIVDTGSGEPLPTGHIGEIVVRSPGVMQGYWRRPDLTAEICRDGWLHTGDLGYLDPEGFLFVVDRVKDMIVTGGENVYSTEVDRVLGGHPAVLECATFGIPDPKWGESVIAAVVLRTGTQATEAELIAHCRARLGSFQCPRSIEIRSGRLPANRAGKILKRELREQYRTGERGLTRLCSRKFGSD